MELLQLREKKIFETLKSLKGADFVIIGGYAVNTYTLPRFSVDCDIVVRDKKALKKIMRILKQNDYAELKDQKAELPYKGEFLKFKKEIKKDFYVSTDILFKKVLDRQTNAVFSADWIFKNSEIRRLKGKTISEELKIRIINIDALFVMKLISCRSTDIRELFMIGPCVKNKAWIKDEVSKHADLKERLGKVKKKILSKQFQDGLQGVFGMINPDIFDKHKKEILSFED